jgi:alpha-tubulin suppressor-like RCC1 family protein
VYAWGQGNDGQLGVGSTANSSVPLPVALPGGVTPIAVSEGYGTSLAVGSDGRVYAWGANQFGQLGDGTTAESRTPEPVSLPGGVAATAVSEGRGTSLALGADGRVYAWGLNQAGQRGGGATKRTAVSAGSGFYLALDAGGGVYAWGANQYGQLGDGTKTRSGSPVQVTLPDGATATAISAGPGTSLAIGTGWPAVQDRP